MGTRSLTFVYDDTERPIINLYRSMDGYPEGHGRELAEFLNGKSIVNGLIWGSDYSKLANGMECLSAQLVAHFKKTAGDFYLYSVFNTDLGQDYEYHIFEDQIVVKDHWEDSVLFTGTWDEYYVWEIAEIYKTGKLNDLK